MALVVKDRVKETTSVVGTGTATLLGAAAGYQSFSVIGNGNTTYYTITDGTDWEVGVGTYTASGGTLSRDTVFESSNSGNKVNWGAGSKEVFVTLPAEGGALPVIGQVVQTAVAPSNGTWLQTGKYYSKATYPALAAALGDVPDIGSPVVAAKAQIPVVCAFNANARNQYLMATNGSAWVFGTSSAPKFIHTTDGAAFSAVPPNATLNSINSVWYVNNQFVATTTPNATGAAILVSADGLSWSSRTMRLPGGATTATTSVAYNSGRYVFTYAGGILYSSDLQTFTQATSAGTSSYSKVIYAGSQYVAVSANRTIFTSSDGITWTDRTPATLITYQDVAYLNGLYIAYGDFSTGNLATSSDGVTWTSRSLGSGNVWQVIYANSLYVAATTGGVYTSSDGVTWTLQTSGLQASSIRSIAYIGSTYYLGAAGSGYYATSSNGSTWTLKRDASAGSFFAFFEVNSKVIAAGDTGLVVISGGTREAYQPAFNFTATATAVAGKAVAYNGSDQYVMVASSGLPLSSSDGEDWIARPLSTGGTFSTGNAHVAYLNGNYLIYGTSGTSSVHTSSNGIDWTVRTTPSTSGLNAAAYGASTYVVVGAGGNTYSSTDLVTWTSRSAGSNAFNDIVFGNSLFVSVGAAGAVYTSADGVTWTSRSAGANQFFRVLWIAGSVNLFIAIGAAGAVYTSPDGTTWTSRSAGATQFNDIAYDSTSGTIVIVGNSGVIYSSTDGTTWTARTPGDTTYNLGIVVWDGTAFIAVPLSNAASAAFRSTDGTTWTRSYVPGNIARLQYLGGKLIRTPSSNSQVFHSTDGRTWIASVQNTYRSANLSQLQKVGNVYFTNAGFYSTDGITFSPSRSFVSANVAYDNTYYYASIKGTGSSVVIYRSSNGYDWAYLSEFGTSASTTLQATAWGDMLYANSKLVAFTPAFVVATSTDAASVYYSSDGGSTWTPGQFPVGGFPGTTGSSGVGNMATDGTTLVASATTASVSYGMYKSSDGGATWSSFFGSTFAPIIYTGGYWYWQSFKTADATTVSGANTTTLIALNTYNGYTFNILGNSAGIWETSSNNNLPYLSYQMVTPGPYGLVSGTKPAPIRTSDNRVLAMANVASFAATIANPISEYPLFSYDTSTTFFVPQQANGIASNEYIYAGA